MELKRLNNLTDLIELLLSIDNSETSEMGFDMGETYHYRHETQHPCGSACCIGGWVQACNGKKYSITHSVKHLQPDLEYNECYKLCFPNSNLAIEATPEQAAEAVRILRDTGKCDWEKALQS